MKLFSEWLLEYKGLPTSQEQYMCILRQLQKEIGRRKILPIRDEQIHVVIPAHWVEGKNIVCSDEEPYSIEDVFNDWDLLKEAGLPGEISGFRLNYKGDSNIEISFNLHPHPQRL